MLYYINMVSTRSTGNHVYNISLGRNHIYKIFHFWSTHNTISVGNYISLLDVMFLLSIQAEYLTQQTPAKNSRFFFFLTFKENDIFSQGSFLTSCCWGLLLPLDRMFYGPQIYNNQPYFPTWSSTSDDFQEVNKVMYRNSFTQIESTILNVCNFSLIQCTNIIW